MRNSFASMWSIVFDLTIFVFSRGYSFGRRRLGAEWSEETCYLHEFI
jgi:hypothetical protein